MEKSGAVIRMVVRIEENRNLLNPLTILNLMVATFL